MLSFQSLVAVGVLSLPLLSTAKESKASVDALIEAGHWKRVRNIAEAELRSNPNDAQAHFWLAKVLPGFSDFDSALAHAERAVALDANNPAYHGQLAEVNALIADRSTPIKGLIYVRRMRKEIDAALAIDPKHIDSLLVDMMFSFKAPSLAGGDKKKAFRIADQIQSISPEWGYLAHARLMQDGNDDAGTEQVLVKAVHADPGFYRARAALAKFYCCTAHHKRPDLAEKAANEAISLDPNAAAAYAILARIYTEAQRWADLDKLLQKAEQAVSDDLSPYYEAAQACVNLGKDFPRAQQYLSRYLTQPPEGREPTHAQARSLILRMNEKEGRKVQSFHAAESVSE